MVSYVILVEWKLLISFYFDKWNMKGLGENGLWICKIFVGCISFVIGCFLKCVSNFSWSKEFWIKNYFRDWKLRYGNK